ncbi:protein odr-4 homolog isoform X2 [Acanthaster planci]|uniref:Protein odr-4 homolog isoform X2 n=1 Tax=Acanthaster planci TaxID=133434 RepID=A0A8B8A3E7_ACAPL|nr:protein odr-4 homolog isoform X2 [Acanthaster planci]
MGKTILADEGVQVFVNGLYGAHSWMIGLVVGHCTSQKDFAVCLVPSPKEEIEDEETNKQTMLDGVSEHWIAEHARQVTRMLPGGLGVTGVFALAPPEMMRSAQAKLRQVLFAVHKLLRKHRLLEEGEVTTEWAMLQICATSRKLTCRTFDVSNPQSTAKPADWKFQSFLSRWPYLHCRIHVDITVPVRHQAADCGQYSKQISAGLSPFVETIHNSLALVNGQLRDPQDSLEAAQTKRKSGKKSSGAGGPSALKYSVELLAQNIKHCDNKVQHSPCSARIQVHGVMESRSYVHNKATVEEAIQAVKEDVIRSLQARLELLSDELRQSSTEEEVKEVDTEPPCSIATPKRVFANLPGTHISVCDYAFRDETAQDSLDRLNELLNLQVTDEELELEAEKVPDDSDMEASEKSSFSLSAAESEEGHQEARKRKPVRYLGAALGAAGALLAAGLSYLVIQHD